MEVGASQGSSANVDFTQQLDSMQVPMKRSIAKEIIDDLRLMALIQLQAPYTSEEFDFTKPTIHKPVERTIRHTAIVAKPIKFVLYRNSDHTVVHIYTAGSEGGVVQKRAVAKPTAPGPQSPLRLPGSRL